jgi:hypothetical protein
MGTLTGMNDNNIDYVCLGSGIGLTLTQSWVGNDVSTVIRPCDISKIILLRAITSAPDDIDIDNIVRSIAQSTIFELHDLYFSEQITWEAVFVVKDDEYLHYQSDGEWVHIETKGGGGFFKWNNKYQ